VFKAALAKLQLLRPGFVLSVGDFIHGYGEGMKPLTDEAVVREKRQKVDEMLGTLSMPDIAQQKCPTLAQLKGSTTWKEGVAGWLALGLRGLSFPSSRLGEPAASGRLARHFLSVRIG
jgi:hypothetical protein